jgi:hypothetical protein
MRSECFRPTTRRPQCARGGAIATSPFGVGDLLGYDTPATPVDPPRWGFIGMYACMGPLLSRGDGTLGFHADPFSTTALKPCAHAGHWRGLRPTSKRFADTVKNAVRADAAGTQIVDIF